MSFHSLAVLGQQVSCTQALGIGVFRLYRVFWILTVVAFSPPWCSMPHLPPWVTSSQR